MKNNIMYLDGPIALYVFLDLFWKITQNLQILSLVMLLPDQYPTPPPPQTNIIQNYKNVASIFKIKINIYWYNAHVFNLFVYMYIQNSGEIR